MFYSHCYATAAYPTLSADYNIVTDALNFPRTTARGFDLRRTTWSSTMKELVGRVRGRTLKSTKYFIVPHVRKNFEIPNLAFRCCNLSRRTAPENNFRGCA